MAYSELIKNFEKIRGYMREFFVYGFKSRTEYKAKSARSYDNERRRIESWLGDYMSFRQDSSGKNVFLTMDSRSIAHNPLYEAFKAKSFTDLDIALHFYLLDILADGAGMTVRELGDTISEEYLGRFESAELGDESTLRKKLKEYEQLGLIRHEKRGREVVYYLCRDGVDQDSWRSAVSFFSETDPLGVIGSTLLDKPGDCPDLFRYKHYYLLYALDSEIVEELLTAAGEKRIVEVTTFSHQQGESRVNTVFPLKVYVSTQNGKGYLLCYHYRQKRALFIRIDNIRRVKAGPVEKHPEQYEGTYERLRKHLWGVSLRNQQSLDHVEMTVRAGAGEAFIQDRLEREKRCGMVERIDDTRLRFTADVFDAGEMLPWIRTFIGRIESLECSNQAVSRRFYEDFETMEKMYGGGGDAVQ